MKRAAGDGLAPFQRLQMDFAAHLRNPEKYPPLPGIEARRMKVYSDLFIRNMEGMLASSFPVLRRLLPAAHWQSLVRDFYEHHQSHSPQFHRIAGEFLAYLQAERGELAGDPPFLAELAHYEWVELALDLAEAEADPTLADPNGDLLSGVPLVSPLAWPLVYRWPVHRLAPEYQPDSPPAQPTCLLVWRDRQDEVRFMEINPLTARLLELCDSEPDSGQALLDRIANELGHPEPEQVIIAAGTAMLATLRGHDIILGTRRPAVD